MDDYDVDKIHVLKSIHFVTAARRQKKKSRRTSRSIVTPEAAALRNQSRRSFVFRRQ